MQKIGNNIKYDFIFDISADFVILYSVIMLDVSDLILREIGRTRKISKSKKKEQENTKLKEFEEREALTKEVSEALKEREEKAKNTKEARAKAAAD